MWILDPNCRHTYAPGKNYFDSKKRTYYETGSKTLFICAIETSESSYPSQFEFSCLTHVSLYLREGFIVTLTRGVPGIPPSIFYKVQVLYCQDFFLFIKTGHLKETLGTYFRSGITSLKRI
jgi:hypothetical protein